MATKRMEIRSVVYVKNEGWGMIMGWEEIGPDLYQYVVDLNEGGTVRATAEDIDWDEKEKGMNLRETAIGNVEKIISDFVDEKLPNKTIKKMATYMKVIAANAFRLGYLAGCKNDITEEQFMAKLYGTNADPMVSELLTDITFRLMV